MDRRCSFLQCGKPSIVTLKELEYCLTHFILVCYGHIEQSLDLKSGEPETEAETKVRIKSLFEIIDQATHVGLTTGNLTNQERGQLLDILLWTSDLLLRGRR